MLDPAAYRTLIGPHGRTRLEEIRIEAELTPSGWVGSHLDIIRWMCTHPSASPVFFSAPRQLVEMKLTNCEIIWPRFTWLDEVQSRIGGADPLVWMNTVWPEELRQKVIPSLVPFWMTCEKQAKIKAIMLKEVIR